MSLLRYAWCFWTAWRLMKRDGFGWAGYTYCGVQQFSIIMAEKRESWRVTHMALEAGWVKKNE